MYKIIPNPLQRCSLISYCELLTISLGYLEIWFIYVFESWIIWILVTWSHQHIWYFQSTRYLITLLSFIKKYLSIFGTLLTFDSYLRINNHTFHRNDLYITLTFQFFASNTSTYMSCISYMLLQTHDISATLSWYWYLQTI